MSADILTNNLFITTELRLRKVSPCYLILSKAPTHQRTNAHTSTHAHTHLNCPNYQIKRVTTEIFGK